MTDRLKLNFKLFGQSIEFINCPEMAYGFLSILRGWEVSETAAGDPQKPIVSFERVNGKYLWKSDTLQAPRFWKKRPPRDPVEAVCDFHYYFLDWFAIEHPTYFSLHAAAVEFADGLVVFPCVQRAGKSTLAAQLARIGYPVFCDDVLPIEIGSHQGLALGLLPRLRLPLPPNVPEAYRSFVGSRFGLADERCVYLALREGEIAPFGIKRPVCGVVSLTRFEESKPAMLQPLPVGIALKQLIDQNFAEEVPPLTIFDDLHDLASKARRFELCYFDVVEASDMLAREFGGTPETHTEAAGVEHAVA